MRRIIAPGPYNRRSFLAGALGLTSFVLAPDLGSEEAEVPVWRDLTQEELDAAYNQGQWAPDWARIWDRYATRSETVRSRLGEPQSFEYGSGLEETLDLYATDEPDAPVHVFIHGGAWFTGDARRHGFLAEPFVENGAHFIAINYASVDDTNGSLLPLADQARRAVEWVFRNAGTFGGDRRRIYLSGHSAGAHLAAVALTTDWVNNYDMPQDVIKGSLLVSGMFELEPVSLSDRREYVDFDERTVEELSPQRHLEYLACPITIAYGSHESPEFKRQSIEFAAAVRAVGKSADLVEARNYNHFEILETLANPYGVLGYRALRQMQAA